MPSSQTSALPENDAIRPLGESAEAPCARARIRSASGEPLDEKPAHMTHLLGTALVSKAHPRIVLRGKSDSLQAQMLLARLAALDAGDERTSEALGELIAYARALMAAEVADSVPVELTMLGMDADRIHEASHDPKRWIGVGHLLPDVRMGAVALHVNALRCVAREAELACVAAYERDDGSCARPDMVQGYNLLSSALYVLELLAAARFEHLG